MGGDRHEASAVRTVGKTVTRAQFVQMPWFTTGAAGKYLQ